MTLTRIYSRAELLSDAVVHLAGLAAVAVAVPVLIVVTALWRGDAPSLVGISVYAATLVAMLGCSALYNMVRRPGWAGLLRRLDHSAIYLKIAGTYTPFTLLTGGQGALLTLSLWGAAAAGVAMKVAAPDRFRRVGLWLYVAMGWAGLAAGWALFSALSPAAFVLILVGGGLYSAGLVVFLLERVPFHNTIWHVFVLAASLVFYAAVTTQVITGAA